MSSWHRNCSKSSQFPDNFLPLARGPSWTALNLTSVIICYRFWNRWHKLCLTKASLPDAGRFRNSWNGDGVVLTSQISKRKTTDFSNCRLFQKSQAHRTPQAGNCGLGEKQLSCNGDIFYCEKLTHSPYT